MCALVTLPAMSSTIASAWSRSFDFSGSGIGLDSRWWNTDFCARDPSFDALSRRSFLMLSMYAAPVYLALANLESFVEMDSAPTSPIILEDTPDG